MQVPKATILVVDDDEQLLRVLCTFLDGRGYRCHGARSAQEALDTISHNEVDVALIDIIMEGTSGIELMETLSRQYPHLPCIVITGVENEETARIAFERGAYGYIVKPFRFFEVIIHIENALRRRRLEEFRNNHLGKLEEEIRARTRELEFAVVNIHQILSSTIRAMAMVVETRDPYTAGHQHRVANLASVIAQAMQLSRAEVEAVYTASLLHDIGKIAVPAEILSKPGTLDPVEFELIKRHTTVGYNILKDVNFGFPIHDIVHQHHERLDGSGYPQGITAHEILLEARIIAVSDVVEAMISHRPYRPALGMEVAIEEIQRHQGTLYDRDVVMCCVDLLRNKGFTFTQKS